MAHVLGILVEHDGAEYLVATDRRGLPDVRQRQSDGSWRTLKHRAQAPGGWTAQGLLQALSG
jgi:hypothetical protein